MADESKEKDRTHLRVTKETKAALDKHQKATGSKSANDAIANLLDLDIDTPQSKAKKTRGIYKEHSGPSPVIMDTAILRCWELEVRYYEATKDKTRAEIITTVKEAMERIYPNGTTWMRIYPRWYKESLEGYVDDRLKALKAKGFINNSKKGAWTMISSVLEEDEWDLLRLVSERIHPHKQLNISDLLRPRESSL